MLSVGQLVTELLERDQEAIVKLDGNRDIINIEVLDDGNISIEGEIDGAN